MLAAVVIAVALANQQTGPEAAMERFLTADSCDEAYDLATERAQGDSRDVFCEGFDLLQEDKEVLWIKSYSESQDFARVIYVIRNTEQYDDASGNSEDAQRERLAADFPSGMLLEREDGEWKVDFSGF